MPGELRVLFVIGQLGRGGAERQLALLARHLPRAGVRPFVLCLGAPSRTRFYHYDLGEVPVLRVERRWGRGVALAQVLRWARRLRPHVVHSLGFSSNFLAWLVARSCGAAAVGASRSDLRLEIAEAGPVIGRLSARYPALLACNSHFSAETARALGGFWAPRTVAVLPNAVEASRFPSAGGRGEGLPRLIGIGNLLPYKRWDRAIRAVAWLHERGLPVQLSLLGDGAERGPLRALADRLGLAAFVELPGNVEDVDARLAAADVLVHCSSLEGAPNAVMEGMAAGLACVVADAGDVPRLVDHGVTGLRSGVDDDDAFRANLERAVADRALRHRLGEAARRHVVERYSVEASLGEAMRLYRTALAARAGAGAGYFDEPDRYLHRRFGVDLRAEVLRSILGEPPGGRVLDVGCGDGSVSLPLARSADRLTLLDPSSRMLDLAARNTPADLRPRVEYVNADLGRFAAPEPYDVVICLGVLAHVGAVEVALAKLAALTRPGGSCILQLTDHDQAVARLQWAAWRLRRVVQDPYGHPINRTRLDETLALARRSGLEPAEVRRYSIVPPGSGRLPDAWHYRLQKWVLDRPALARHGSEAIVKLVRAR